MRRAIMAAVFYGLLGIGCIKYVKPETLANTKSSAKEVAYQISDAVKLECDRSYVTYLKDNTLVVCDKKFGNIYRMRFGIPLEKICDVSIEERRLWRDDILYIRTNDSIFHVKMGDRVVKKVGSLLASYVKLRGKECEDIEQP